MGFRPDSEEFKNKALNAAMKYGDEAVAVSKNDVEKLKSWFTRESFPKEEIFSIVGPKCLNMMVVKLNSGGLLLYAPVKVHMDAKHLFVEFLEALGPVKYLVAASNNSVIPALFLEEPNNNRIWRAQTGFFKR